MLLLLIICSGRKGTNNVSHESDSMKFSTRDQSICAYNISLLTDSRSNFEGTVMSRYNDLRQDAATLSHNALTRMKREYFQSSRLGRRAIEGGNTVLCLVWSFQDFVKI